MEEQKFKVIIVEDVKLELNAEYRANLYKFLNV